MRISSAASVAYTFTLVVFRLVGAQILYDEVSDTFLTSVLHTKNGKVQGKLFNFGDDRKVGAYLGIPYAAAPSGRRRFQKPVATRNWGGIRRMTNFGPSCYFLDTNHKPHMEPIRFSEDCLHLNVFTPVDDVHLKPKGNRTVMVYIHGGAYVTGTAAMIGDEGIARILALKDVVVVTLNYRTGIFGFFTTGDENAPGNQALWDVRQALVWVQQNIRTYGGNPHDVMLFGQSAGGSATHAMLISPVTKGLFHKAAPMSGVTGENGITTAAGVRAQMLDLALFLGFEPSNIYDNATTNAELVRFMETVPPEKLAMGGGYNVGYDYPGNGKLKMVPVYDQEFLPGNLDERLASLHDIPLMTGDTAYEALAFLPKEGTYDAALNMVTYYTKGDRLLAKTAMDFFVDSSLPPTARLYKEQCVQVVSDIVFNKDIYRLAEMSKRRREAIYLYTFRYYKQSPALQNYAFPGATHCSDLQFLFGVNENEEFRPDFDDQIISEQLSTYYVNFAKYSNPNGKTAEQSWQPVDPQGTYPQYLSIDINSTRLMPEFMDGRMQRWEQVDRQVNSARALTTMSTVLMSMFHSWSASRL